MISHPFLKQNYFIFQDLLHKVTSLSEFLTKLDSSARFLSDGNLSKYGFIIFGEAFLKLAGKSQQITNITNLNYIHGNSQADMTGNYATTAHPVFIKFDYNHQRQISKRLVIKGIKTSSDLPNEELIENSDVYGMPGEVTLVISRNEIHNPVVKGQVDFYSPKNLNAFATPTFWSDFRNAI